MLTQELTTDRILQILGEIPGDFLKVRSLANVISAAGKADDALYKAVQKLAREMSEDPAGGVERQLIRKGADRGTFYRVPVQPEASEPTEAEEAENGEGINKKDDDAPPEEEATELEKVLADNQDITPPNEQVEKVTDETAFGFGDGGVLAVKFRPVYEDPPIVGRRHHVTLRRPDLPVCENSTMVIALEVEKFEEKHEIADAALEYFQCPECGSIRRAGVHKKTGLLFIKYHNTAKNAKRVPTACTTFYFKRQKSGKTGFRWVKVPAVVTEKATA